jgi:hypothetical protein
MSTKNGHKVQRIPLPRRTKKSLKVSPDRSLTTKQTAFALIWWELAAAGIENATEAYRRAGYKGSPSTLGKGAFELLRNPKVIQEIDRLRSQAIAVTQHRILSSHEVLVGLSHQAKADIADVFEADGTFDLQKAKARGVSCLIKRITRDPKTGFVTGIELYDGQAAYLLMGKYYRLFDRGGYGAIEDDQEKARQVLAKLAGTKPHLLPPANPLIVDGELIIDGDTEVALDKEQ